MSYISMKEKVFDLPDADESSSVVSVNGSDHKLKIFPSVERVCTQLDECNKYKQKCGSVNSKEQSDGTKPGGFKFVPVEVLLPFLMAEKDACIQELLEKQKNCTCGERTEVLFKEKEFNDSEDDKEALIRKDAEVVSLKNRNAMLESELEECKDTLRKAMHKLEDVEVILNENEILSDKLKYTEEKLRLSEESQKNLEITLENIRRGNDAVDPESWNEKRLIQSLSNERNILKQEVDDLSQSLEMAKASLIEMEMLKKQKESILENYREISRQNEDYKKTLEGTKQLEKSVEDLKEQALCLTEKYRKESQRANEQKKLLITMKKEVDILRKEKEVLQQKVVELSSFESDYYIIKKKLSKFEEIIDENEILNSKLSIFDKMESENKGLRSEIDRLKSIELDSKNEIIRMQNDLGSQEEEIKNLISQLNILSEQYVEQEEYNNLLKEIQEKNQIMKENEKKLKDVEILRSESNNLRDKLQKYMDDVVSYEKSNKQLQDELHMYKEKCNLLEESSAAVCKEPKYIATRFEEKVRFANELSVIQELVTETCPVFELRSSGDGSKIGEEFNTGNNPERAKVIEQELNKLKEQQKRFNEILALKDKRIQALENDLFELKNCEKCQDLRKHCSKLENDIIKLEEINEKLQNQITFKMNEEIELEEMKNSLKIQKNALDFSKRLITELEEKLWSEMANRNMAVALTKLVKEEGLLSRKELCVSYLTEIDCLKNEIDFRKKLMDEIKEENMILRKTRTLTEFKSKRTFENVLRKLKAELLVLQNFSRPELGAECRILQAEVTRLINEAENLKAALDEEKKSKDGLEKKLSFIQEELSCALKPRDKASMGTMTVEFEDQSEKIQEALDEIKQLKEENDEFVMRIAMLEEQCKDFEDEVTTLQNDMDHLEKSLSEEKDVTAKQKDEINALNEKIKKYEVETKEMKMENDEFNQKAIALREELTAKEAELDTTKKELTDLRNEITKLNTETEDLKDRLEREENSAEKDLEESECAILKVEKELEELKKKLESCNTVEEKLSVLRTQRDNLIVKVNCFDSEVEFLKKKLIECDCLKMELEQLKAEKKSMSDSQMNSEEKLLSDIFGLKDQIKLQQKEIERARSENTNLKEKLNELGQVLEVCKKLHKETYKTDVGTNHSGATLDKAEDLDGSSSSEKLANVISIEEFKTEIAKIETKHKTKVQELKDGNSRKIKRLMEQYEKESKSRDKAYNESMNNMRSNYESDIRKLVEKHKASIIRLQNLHEDEVQELNMNYETQMEAMQTLNENVVNDLTSGAAEKCKLTERYDKEIRDIESNFQKLLKEKENHHKIVVDELREDLSRTVNEQKELHKRDIDNLSRMYEKNLAEMEEKHNKELKIFKKNNLKRTEIMRDKYETLLTEERKKFEENLQIMLDRLTAGHQEDEFQEKLKYLYLNRKAVAGSPRPLEFNRILKKIMDEGLQSLQFHELMLVHSKTCFATEGLFQDPKMRAEHEGDLIGDGCPHMPLLKEDKEQLLKRIFVLENEIAIKQLETHEAIINMETAEKCRIEQLNVLLINEKEKNAELKKMLTNQSQAQTDLKIESYVLDKQAALHETNYIEKVKEVEVERSERRRLEEELKMERNNSKRLSLILENERHRFETQRKKDSEYIEAMRMRLEEAISHEQIMESQLDFEAQFRKKLEFEIHSLQRSFNLIADQNSSTLPLEHKTVKDIKNLDQFESEKEEKLTKNRNKIKYRKNS